MLNLNKITILSINTRDPELSIKAIERSCKYIKFAKAILLTDKPIKHNFIESVIINKINNIQEYSYFCVKELNKFVDTEFCLMVQPDGFVTNPLMWTDDFLNYDYIGAPWILPLDDFSYRDAFGNIVRVGNGGFSLRSKKLLSIADELNIPWKSYYGFYNEDGFIACHNRHIYEHEGCKFAPLEVAVNFSKELEIPENVGIKTFGVHGIKNAFD